MMKHLKYIFLAAMTMMAATGCQEDWEDTFSTKPTAPELANNGMIMMTKNTMPESITWTWSAARFLQGDVTYSLFAQYQTGEPVQVGTPTSDLTLSVTKTDFHAVLETLVGTPTNGSYDVNFFVRATDAVKQYESAKQMVKVHAYLNFVSAQAKVEKPEVVLDINTPSESLTLLSWEPARMGYKEEITYNVTMSYGDKAPKMVAEGLKETSCTKTVDEWNELAVAAGAPEAKAADLNFVVTAFSKSVAEGLPSEPVKINMTTYVATYPDCLYLPGGYQGWNPATATTIAQSKAQKGLFEAFVDLSTADGSDVEFKFSPEPNWGKDFGCKDPVIETDKDGNVVVNGVTGASDNIKVPSGMYLISMDMKFKKLFMLKIESVGMIGDATPGDWGEETPMAYDAEKHAYSVKINMIQGKEYKFRFNNNWTYSIGDNGRLTGGANYKFEKESGEYKITLNVNQHPYGVQILSTSFPEEEYIFVPGNHQGWNPGTAPAMWCPEHNGVYTGYMYLDGDFKFTKVRDWKGEYNSSHFTNYEGGAEPSNDGSNIKMPKAGFYKVIADVMNAKLTTIPTQWGVIGDATPGDWGSDTDMTWNADKKCWAVTMDLKDGTIKFRANDDWPINFGGDIHNLNEGGGNIPVTAGTYDIELYLERTTTNNVYCVLNKK